MEGECKICGIKGRIHRHHISYEQEKVISLCPACHIKVHRNPTFFPLYRNLDKRRKRVRGKGIFIDVSITIEERKRIKDWADKEEIRLPRAYTELLQAGMKAKSI